MPVNGESRGERFGRRLRTVPAVVAGFVLVTALLPVLVVALLAYDAVRALRGRGRFSAVRLLLFGWVYLAVETAGLTAMLLFWLASGFGRARRLYVTLTYALQGWWAAALFGAMRLLFRVGLEVEGDEANAPGPMVLMMRHASLADTLLPTVLVLRRHKIRLRYVLKRRTAVGPGTRRGGQRAPQLLPGPPVHRRRRRGGTGASPGGGPRRTRRGAHLPRGHALHPGEEGAGARGRCAVASPTWWSGPRPSGGCWRRARRAFWPCSRRAPTVVVCAHVGLDGLSHVKRVWRGGLVGVIVRVAFWRIPAGEIPTGEEARIDWLVRPVAPGGRLGLRPPRRTVLRRT